MYLAGKEENGILSNLFNLVVNVFKHMHFLAQKVISNNCYGLRNSHVQTTSLLGIPLKLHVTMNIIYYIMIIINGTTQIGPLENQL